MWNFYCPACRENSWSEEIVPNREGNQCAMCQATNRERAVLHGVQTAAEQMELTRAHKPRIIGISDSAATSMHLARLYGRNYRNFHYHRRPRLDITNVKSRLAGSADIVICSDVLEHIKPPVEKGFEGIAGLLRPGGFAVISVPHRTLECSHVEHYVRLRNDRIIHTPDAKYVGYDEDNNYVEYENPVFHGGQGSTLEFRIFSESSLITFIELSGLNVVEIIRDNHDLGIAWEPWSRVWLVNKPQSPSL